MTSNTSHYTNANGAGSFGRGRPASPATAPAPAHPVVPTKEIHRFIRLQTSIPSQSYFSQVPLSAISSSSVASSRHASPVSSPQAAGLPNMSFQSSPEPVRGRDVDALPPLQLPDALLSRHNSASSLAQTIPTSASTTVYTTNTSNGIAATTTTTTHTTTAPTTTAAISASTVASATASAAAASAASSSHKGGIIRRFSSRASRFPRPRRQSSTHPVSRDGSVGPSLVRRGRSDSRTMSETDLDDGDDHDDFFFFGSDLGVRDLSPTSAATSFHGSVINAAAAASAGACSLSPFFSASLCSDESAHAIIPPALLKGSGIFKVSPKRKAPKRVPLILEPDAAKLTWGRPSKCIYIDDIKEIRTGSDIRQYRLDSGLPESEESRFFSILYALPEKSRSKMMHLVADDDQTFHDWVNTLDVISQRRQDSMACLMSFNAKALRQYWTGAVERITAESAIISDAVSELGLPAIERLCRELKLDVSPDIIRARFLESDTTASGRLSFDQFVAFVRRMARREDVRAIYRELASDADLGITRHDFLEFLREVQGEDIDADLATWDAVFDRFARRDRRPGRDLLGADDMSTMAGGGDDDASATTCSSAVGPRMSESALASFLVSPYNSSIAKPPPQYSLDRPMNEYYISSSHNTYLLGRQVKGSSSIEGYISALSGGCRCVEVDCWDGSDGQPIVMHGMTLTTHIQFREVISTINRYAFVRSQFPLWISLEVHCGPAQQAIMVDIMKSVFGPKLVTEPLDPSSDRLPSPDELKGRILIKVKKSRAYEGSGSGSGNNNNNSSSSLNISSSNTGSSANTAGAPNSSATATAAAAAATTTTNTTITSSSSPSSIIPESVVGSRRRGNSLTSPYRGPVQLDNMSVPPSPLSTPNLPPRRAVSARTRVNTINEGQVQETVSSTVSSSTEDNESGSDKDTKKKGQSKIIKLLGDLGVYSVGVKFRGFEHPDSKSFNHIHSFMESTFTKHAKPSDSKRALFRHNMRYMMRVYPHQFRVNSNNFDPLISWRRGVQMAALNWQTFDLGMQLNQAMFEGGADQSGYVLKPSEFREFQVVPNLPGELLLGKRERKNLSFSIDVISAQQLARPDNLPEKRSMDPYVEVEVFLADDKRDKEEAGNRTQDTRLKYRTQIIHENGFNPVFDRKFNFNVTTKYPDLAFVRWNVKLSENGAYTDRLLATWTAKLSSLRQGYRTLRLQNASGDQYLFSTLFCRIKVDPITSIFVSCADGSAGDSHHGSSTSGSGNNSSNSSNKFKSIGRTVFNRSSANMSPKSSIDGGHS